jgi:hypothetical protein
MQTDVQSPDRVARVKRVRRRGCPQIIEALDHGELGLKTLERISRLPVEKQSMERARRLAQRAANARRQAAWRTDPQAGKTPFASQAYAEARKLRLRRIERTATPELKEACEEGRYSLRQYDLLSKLSPVRQKKALRLDFHKEQAQNLAAATIRAVLGPLC